MKNFTTLQHSLRKQGLNLQQLVILQSIPKSMTELSRLLQSSTANATGLIDHLESKHLVSRSHDKADRRKITVHPTDKAKEVLQTIEGEVS